MTESQVTSTTEADQKQIGQTKSSNFLGFIRGLPSRIILNLALISTLLTIAGYFVVHSYLGKISNLSTYEVAPVVCISAGVNTILGTAVRVFELFLPQTLVGIAIGVVFAVLLVIMTYFIRKIEALQDLVKQTDETIEKHTPLIQKLWKAYNIFVIAFLLFIFISLGTLYGRDGYEYSPRSIGGGKPSNVLLLFSQPEKLPLMGLPIQINPTHPAQSQPVELLMELNDGVLVRDPQTQIPVIIRNDLLYGMIDAAPPATATPQP